MASYREPTFNLVCSIWRWATWGGGIPPANPPDLVADCQLRWPGNSTPSGGGGAIAEAMSLLLPKLTDIRGGLGFGTTPADFDLVEVPALSGRFYTVAWVDDVAKGFTNEHRFAIITQVHSPHPIP